jgi:hypothetical protein
LATASFATKKRELAFDESSVSFYTDTCSFLYRHAFPQCLRFASTADPKAMRKKWRPRKLGGVHTRFVHEILNGKVTVPASARPLLHEIGVSAR